MSTLYRVLAATVMLLLYSVVYCNAQYACHTYGDDTVYLEPQIETDTVYLDLNDWYGVKPYSALQAEYPDKFVILEPSDERIEISAGKKTIRVVMSNGREFVFELPQPPKQ